jgi:hypothetical protein
MLSQLPTGHVKRPIVGRENCQNNCQFGERLLQAPDFSHGVLDVLTLPDLLLVFYGGKGLFPPS